MLMDGDAEGLESLFAAAQKARNRWMHSYSEPERQSQRRRKS
jgi:hypothetical protein